MTLIAINKPTTTAAVKSVSPHGEKTSAVFAYIKRGSGYGKRRVSPWMTYSEALVRFGKLEHHHSIATQAHPLGAGGGPVHYLAVRSKSDPKWNTAKRATVVRRDRDAVKARSGVRAI